MNSNNQGNGLFIVLIIVSAIAFGVYSVADLIKGELRMNKRAETYHEARQAVESLIQYAAADLHARCANSTRFPQDFLSPANRPLSISNDFLADFNDSNSASKLVIPNVLQYSSINEFFSEDTEIIGGTVSPGVNTLINRFDTGDELDPQIDISIFKRTVEIFGKATVNHPSFGDLTVYASQFIEIREIPLFSFAIFYNLPMEIAPGEHMEVHGNVHTNSDAWFQAGSGKSLNFNAPVTIAGDLHHGRRPNSGQGEKYGEVNFINDSDDLINMQNNVSWPADAKSLFSDDSGDWLESSVQKFREIAEIIWNGNLKTQAPIIQLPGVSEYIEDTNLKTPEKESLNSAYTIVQPTLNEIDVPSREEDLEGHKKAKAKQAAEKNKFSYMAGLTIEVSDDGSLSYYRYQRNSYDDIVYGSDGSPQKIALTPPSSEIAQSKTFKSTPGGTIQRGLYDKRQRQNMSLVEVDVAMLTDLINKDDPEGWGGGGEHEPEDWWNGVVYVKFPQKSASSTRKDNVNPAKARNWGVKLVNGNVIPNPAFAQNKGIFGMSVATNQVMYVEGNYNSDGNITSDSSTKPDDTLAFNKVGQEAPAALAADAVTFLSEGWDDTNSNKPLANRIAEPTEVSAAILTGVVPSRKDGTKSYSGGVENLPRFLENWSGKDFVMRGSMVALFESEVATAPWGKKDNGDKVYSAPNRKWGYHTNYDETPPVGPTVRTYRARELQILSQNAYQTRVRNNWNLNTNN